MPPAVRRKRAGARVRMTSAMEPTYFLYAGRLFHEAALPALAAELEGHGERAPTPSRDPGASPWQPRRGEDPGPEGPEGEPVGEEDEAPDEDATDVDEEPSSGPGVPSVPEHGSPDAG
ncbi:MAG: hypothetical protein KF764_32415 [Labilithrix sp.]|nr:hypothetical protein [Labilithrix sp.]MBX3221453.1 hypothetical protein [Labilithrix sp.]